MIRFVLLLFISVNAFASIESKAFGDIEVKIIKDDGNYLQAAQVFYKDRLLWDGGCEHYWGCQIYILNHQEPEIKYFDGAPTRHSKHISELDIENLKPFKYYNQGPHIGFLIATYGASAKSTSETIVNISMKDGYVMERYTATHLDSWSPYSYFDLNDGIVSTPYEYKSWVAEYLQP